MAKPMQTWIDCDSSPKSPEPLPSPPCHGQSQHIFRGLSRGSSLPYHEIFHRCQFIIQTQYRRSIRMNFKHEFSVGPQALVATIMAAVLLVACGSGTNTSTNTINVVPIVIDAGPVPGASEINVAYVSVTVCTPGTSACQTIDHVLLDTGSSGLRLLNSALYSNLNLPAVTNSSGAIGECMTFAEGFTWG